MDILEVTRNWQRDGRWSEVEPHRDQMMREARRSGLEKDAARKEVYAKLLEMFPQATQPPPQMNEGSEAGGGANLTGSDDGASGATHARDGEAVKGLSVVPEDWPDLPANATLSAEIQWVQANRLRLVRETQHGTEVDLRKAMSPAPSWSALGWLETSIRAYSKFVDVAAKASATMEDEREMVKREKLAIEEVRGLLAEMLAE